MQLSHTVARVDIVAVIPGEGYSFDIDRIAVANNGTDDLRQRRDVTSNMAFTGHMQNMVFGGLKLFELVQRQQSNGGSELPDGVASVYNSGELTVAEKPIPLHPVTFKSLSLPYASLPTMNTHQSNGSIQVMFRTARPDALLFFNDGTPPDFMALELIKGRMRLSANNGGGNVTVLHPKVGLNDNTWHLVAVRQIDANKFNFTIDDVQSQDLNLTAKSNTFDLIGPLYVGGLPENVFDPESPLGKAIVKRSFSGCLASVTVDAKLYDVMQYAAESSGLIVPGCHSKKVIKL